MQEIDEAITKAESASLTMQMVKVQESIAQPEMTIGLGSSPDKVLLGRIGSNICLDSE